MKKILMSVYAACALLVIIGSLLWFVFTLNSDSAAGKVEALKSFKIFAQHTGEILSEAVQENDHTRLQIRLEQLCRNYSKYIQAVLMRDTAGIVFIWPNNSDVFSYNEQYVVEVKNLPLFFTAAQIHIPIKSTGNTVTVHAAFRTLPLETVFNRGQIVFFLLLLIVLMTIMVLIFSYIGLKPAEKKSKLKNAMHTPETDIAKSGAVQPCEYPSAAADNETAAIPPVKTAAETDIPISRQKEDLSTGEKALNPYEQPSAEKNSAQPLEAASSVPLNEQLESLNRLHIYDDKQPQQTQPEYKENAQNTPLENSVTAAQDGSDVDRAISSSTAETDIPNTEDVPQADAAQGIDAENYGFFENHAQISKTAKQAVITTFNNMPRSDTAGNGAQSLEQATLMEELMTAITETAVAEEDLTLMLIHATDLPHNQQIIHLLKSRLDHIHKVFVFNKDILGVIIFYAALDQAMQIASALYDEIHALLDVPSQKSLSIGLTTRAGRLIPAPRMLEEASAAIGKASQEGSDPIVAFRVNPDQYRRCLARLT